MSKVAFFLDEFTNYLDVETGKKAIKLFRKLGYEVILPLHFESGRAAISKGFLQDAKEYAKKNVDILYPFIDRGIPIVGLEPSAILTFRDEYPDLLKGDLKDKSEQLSGNVFLAEEFLFSEIKKGKISVKDFTNNKQLIKLHGHCHQKSLASMEPTLAVLSFPENYQAEAIPSGCCGMAGSFGYEKEHYDLSMEIGELVLFPAVRTSNSEEIIAAPGTSCRHQIFDGTGRTALHPIEILHDALNK